jgi:GTP-binding protein
MKIKTANFLKSAPDYKQCPPPKWPEYAFIGRSNVGKSSLINMLVENSHLAKTSSRPGKTQLINHFNINDEWYLVDLPGYGFAKVSKSMRDQFDKMIQEYLKNRENLQCVLVLIDSRIPPQPIDLEFMQWLGISGIPFVMVFTKADKQTNNKTLSLISQYKLKMNEIWEEIPQYFITSAETGLGKDELLKFIEEVNVNFTPQKK